MPKATDAAAGDAAVLAEQLASNAVDVLPRGALANKLAMAAAEGRPLRVKLGIDPTAPDIHVGHAVVLRKLRQFQDAGHLVVLIIGDYTARVGDPSGRSSERPLLSPEQIAVNAETFTEQALRILDAGGGRLEVRHNSEWLDMDMAEVLRLARTTTVAQLVERDDFAKRLAANQPVSLLELMYPLLQGYDSVAVRADVELGGTDQKFNLLLGREVQRAYGQLAQAILTMPLLVGIDGRRKMSKSLHNEIGITDAPEEMFGKTMRIPDEAMADYERLLLAPMDARRSTGQPGAIEQAAIERGGGDAREVAPRSADARDRKRALARGLVRWLHSGQEAEAAERHFERVHVQHEAPEGVSEAVIPAASETVHLPEVIAAEFGVSRSQARRLIDQGGATLGEQALAPGEYDVPLGRADGQLLKVGRRRFRRLRAR